MNKQEALANFIKKLPPKERQVILRGFKDGATENARNKARAIVGPFLDKLEQQSQPLADKVNPDKIRKQDKTLTGRLTDNKTLEGRLKGSDILASARRKRPGKPDTTLQIGPGGKTLTDRLKGSDILASANDRRKPRKEWGRRIEDVVNPSQVRTTKQDVPLKAPSPVNRSALESGGMRDGKTRTPPTAPFSGMNRGFNERVPGRLGRGAGYNKGLPAGSQMGPGTPQSGALTTTPGGSLGSLGLGKAAMGIGAVALGSALLGHFRRNAKAERDNRAALREQARPSAMDMVRAQDVAKARQINEMRLATLFPQQYMELAAGQKLAAGDVVIGGQPNREVIESAVDAMMR